MLRHIQNLTPDEIENALKVLFGFEGGTRSEDEEEYSDCEYVLCMSWSNNYEPSDNRIFPELSPHLVSPPKRPSSPLPGPSNENILLQHPPVILQHQL